MTKTELFKTNDISPDPEWPGGLYLIPSPLGHLGDLSLRAIETLKAVDLVAAEDTRRTIKILNHLKLKKSLISYREQNHRSAWPQIAAALERGGKVALLTDAGAPGVSDPGAELVAVARNSGFAIFPLPGPSAVITALMASGFSADRFTFAGFIPSKPKERRDFLKELADQPWTLVFFEAPHRLAASLKDLAEIFGPRQALLAREMTKKHEEFLVAPLGELAEEVVAHPRKGEITLVVMGSTSGGKAQENALDEEMIKILAKNDDRPTKILAAELAKETGHSRTSIYRLLVAAREEDH